jgi:hypothetical protein
MSSLKDLTDFIVSVLKILGIPSLLGAVGWIVWQWWRRRQAGEGFPFEIITDAGEVLPTLLPGRGPLADHALPYQDRVAGRSIEDEMRNALLETGYLLVHAPTGLGKTHEVGRLARKLREGGATILVLRRDGWLDVPADWPEELSHKNLVFVIDDITFHCAKQAQHPRSREMVTVGLPGFQERLC